MDMANAALIVWLVTAAQGSSAGAAPAREWFVAGGLQRQSYGDISRTRRPVDASPVRWEGVGPAFIIGFERRNRARLHRLTMDVAITQSMAYAGPVRRHDAPDADGMRRLEGRYEYRRYPFDDLFMRGRGGTSFMNEGLASAVLTEPRHNGKTHYYTWTARTRAQIPTLNRLVNDDEWQSVPENVSYSASASFLGYVLETYGAEKLRAIYYARSSDFAARFAAVYGKSLAEAEAEWLAFCNAFGR